MHQPKTLSEFIEHLTDLVDEYDLGDEPLLIRTEDGDVEGFAVNVDVYEETPTIVFEEIA